VVAFGPLCRSRTGAEKLIEDHTRIANHRQRFGRRLPRDRIGVNARVTVITTACLVDRLDRKLDRRKRRVLPILLGINLIERNSAEYVGTLRLFWMRLGEKDRAAAEMITADF